MKKTDDEWMEEMLEIRRYCPKPDTPGKEVRAREIVSRYMEIFNYLYSDGPEPDPDWKPAHPPKDEAERQRDYEEAHEMSAMVMSGGLQG